MPLMDAESVASAGVQRRSRFDFTAEVLASYPESNYVDPVTRGPALYIINSIFLAITLVCVALRLYARLVVRKWFGLDDVFIICAIVGAIGVTACIMLGFDQYGWDRHIYDIPWDVLQPSGKILFASKVIWSFTSNAVRASVMVLYYRLSEHIGLAQYRWVLHVVSVSILGLFIAQATTTIFACSPIRAVWTFPLLLTSRCIDNGAALFSLTILNTLSEAIVAALPLPIILSLNFPAHQRNATIALLCGGFSVVLVGCVRTYYIWMTLVTYDPSWWSMPHWICSEVEMDVAIICACMPSIVPVMKRIAEGGTTAAKPTNPSFPSISSNHRTRRARSLFGKLKEQTSFTGLSMTGSRHGGLTRLPSNDKEIDIEGISNDGFGYSVTITTGRGTKVKRRWDIRNKTWHYYPEQPVSDAEGDPDGPGRRVTSRLSSSSSMRKRPMADTAEKGTGIPTMEVQTEKTFNVRESFHSGNFDRGFDYRNPYKSSMPSKYEEDIEIALQIPEVEVNDWSLFDGEVNQRMAARLLPDAEVRHHRTPSRDQAVPSSVAIPASTIQRRRSMSLELQRYPMSVGRRTPRSRRSLDSVYPPSSSHRANTTHRASQSHHNIHLGILPSPSTMDFERHVPPSSPHKAVLSRQSSYTHYAPSSRLSRGSPVQPLNSSQVWATAPGAWQSRHSLNRDNTPSPDNNWLPTHSTDAIGQEEDTPEVRDRVVRHSIRSSLRAENGSGYSMPVQSQRLRPPARQEDDDVSDEEFSLPLQRPSPRNSVHGQRAHEQPPELPPINGTGFYESS